MKFKYLLPVALCASMFMTSCNKEANSEVTSEEVKVSEASASTTEESTETETTADAETQEVTSIEFEGETVYEFGEIKQGDVVEKTFTFKNTGDVPLVISKTHTPCGCTTPSYSKEPVAPGEQGQVDVKFNSKGKRGVQNKTVTIYCNVEGGEAKVTLKGSVIVDEVGNMNGPLKENSEK